MYRIPFGGGHYEGRSHHVNAQECINFYPEPEEQETKGEVSLHATPGLERFTTVGNGPIRGMISHKGLLHVVSGDDFFEVATDGTTTQRNLDVLAAVDPLATSTGAVSMATSEGQGGQIAVADGINLYVYYDMSLTANITGATQANPGVITAPGHGLSNGDQVRITSVGGMTELNDSDFIVTAVDIDTYTLRDTDTSGFTAYTSGGLTTRHRWSSPGFSTDTGDETWGTFTSETNDQGDQAWTNPGNASVSDNTDATVASIGATSEIQFSGIAVNEDRAGSTPAWSNVTNVTASDNNDATATGDSSNPSTDYIYADTFGFSIPTGAIITGFQVLVEGNSDTVVNPRTLIAQLVNEAATSVGSTRSTNYQFITETNVTLGSSTDLWGLSSGMITPADANDADFGVRIFFTASGGAWNFLIDAIRIRIYYYEDSEFLRAVDRSGADLVATDRVTGIEIDIEMATDTAARVEDSEVQLIISGAPQGDNKATEEALATSDTTRTYGGVDDLWGLGSTVITPAAVNSENFGVQISLGEQNLYAGLDNSQIDFINVKLYFTSTGALGPGSIVWVDNYFASNADNSGQWFITNNGAQLWATDTNFATAERDPDNIKAIAVANREIYLFGTRSTEVWYNSGDDFPFDPVPGVFSEWGIAATSSIARIGQSLLWLAQNDQGDGEVVMTENRRPTVVSGPHISYIINKYEKIDDAIGYTMQIAGHSWYILTFPAAGATWVYDLTTGAWFRWSSGGGTGKHLGAYHTLIGHDHILGALTTNRLYKCRLNIFKDDGAPILRTRTSQRIHGGLFDNELSRHRVFFHTVEVEANTGADPIGATEVNENFEPARISLSWSDDDGATFTDRRWRPLGQPGEVKRLRWQMLGSSRERIFRLETESDTDVIIVDANIDATVGAN